MRDIGIELKVSRPNGTWVDVTDYVRSVSVELGSIEDLGTGTGADVGVRTLEFALFGREFSPKNRTSDWNRLGEEYKPLLFPNQRAVLKAHATPTGEVPVWHTLVDAVLGDSVRAAGSIVTVRARDKAKRLQDIFIDEPAEYGEAGTDHPMETIIQHILDDWVPDAPTLLCPEGGTGITMENYLVEYVSVWEAIQKIASNFGWFLGYSTAGDLVLENPPRDKEDPDFHFDGGDIFVEELDVTDVDVRNAISISYKERNTDRRRLLSWRDLAVLKNQESIDTYGLRTWTFKEGDDSVITAQVQALNLALYALHDLSSATTTDKIDLPFTPDLGLFDTLSITNELTGHDEDFYAVESIRHTLRWQGSNSRFRTEVIASDKVIGARRRWLDREEPLPEQPKAATGIAFDGDEVDLFEETKRHWDDDRTDVIVSPLEMLVYDDDYPTENQSILLGASEVNDGKFTVHARTILEAQEYQEFMRTSSTPRLNKNDIFLHGPTTPGTSQITLSVTLHPYDDWWEWFKRYYAYNVAVRVLMRKPGEEEWQHIWGFGVYVGKSASPLRFFEHTLFDFPADENGQTEIKVVPHENYLGNYNDSQDYFQVNWVLTRADTVLKRSHVKWFVAEVLPKDLEGPPEGEELTVISVNNPGGVHVSLGTGFETLGLPSEVAVTLSDSTAAMVPVTWE